MLILLADDERMVRLGLQSMLEELFENKHSFLHAKSGQEVVSLLLDHHPDIAFLDIKMPLMDGLTALKKCREISPSTIWIILSGYADFEFARQAISLSAFEYILKPIDVVALRSLFQRIDEKKAANQIHHNTIFSHHVIRSFNMADQFPLEEVEFLPNNNSHYVLYEFYIDQHSRSDQHHLKQSLGHRLHAFCSRNPLLQNHCQFYNTEGNLCLICETTENMRLTHFITLQSEEFSKGAFSVFYGSAETIKNLYIVSRQIIEIQNIRLLTDCSKPMQIDHAMALPNLSQLLLFAQNINQLLELYIRRNIGAFRQHLQTMAEDKALSGIFAHINSTILKQYLNHFFGGEFKFTSYAELLKEISDYSDRTTHNTVVLNSEELACIKEFISQNYNKDVSISYVSELFNLSPTYLSKLFHEKTGQKYIDFVTQVRMENAKLLLAENPFISIKKIAQLVGYTSVRHFSKVFQRYTGKSPSGFGKS